MDALLVEDEKLLREMLHGSLSDMGFDVEEADSGEAAWEMVQNGLHFDLLLTDVRMPGTIDGIDLAKRVKSIGHDAAIIVMSGFVGSRNPAAEGFNHFLAKPFTEGRLSQLIKKAMAD